MTRLGDRQPDAGQGGHNYLASVSDLVSALIFVFIIMLAVFAYQLANVTEDLTAADETRDRMLMEIATRLKGSGMRVEVPGRSRRPTAVGKLHKLSIRK